MFHDRQFYVNHEARYVSHEIQAFYDVNDSLTFTSGIFSYDAKIDQRGDFYSDVGESRMINAYADNTALSAGAAGAIGAPFLAGINASTLAFSGRPMVELFSARDSCMTYDPAPAAACAPNFGVDNPGALVLQTSAWYGDDGTNRGLDVIHGPSTAGTDLLYTTQSKRQAYAAYTQGVWNINETFDLTFGLRYAVDKLEAQENVWRYGETGAAPGAFLALYGGLAAVNRVNGGLVDDGNGNLIKPTEKVTNGGIPFALSVYRPFEREDSEVYRAF